MPRFIEGQDRQQVTLMPECLDDFIADDNPVRVIEAFVSELDLMRLGFEGAEPATTGRPSYHPADLLKVYIYGYLNRVQSSRRLERECQRNIELMWLTGRLAPDFKTIADFRRDNGAGIKNACRRFVALCRDLKLFSQALVAIDGSEFKAVKARDKNFTAGKIDKRQQQIEESIHSYPVALDTADRTQPAEFEAKTTRLRSKIEQLRQRMRVLDDVKVQVAAQPDGQLSKTDPDARSMATSVLQIEPAEPAIRQVQVHLVAESALRADAEAVADNQHSNHQLRINRRTPGVAVERAEVLAQLAQVEEAVYASQQMVFGDVVIKAERVEQTLLRSALVSHHRGYPRREFGEP